MSHIFLSYAHTDVDTVRAIREALEASGEHCWMAPDDVVGVGVWAEELLAAIRACEAMVVLISPDSMASRHVAREVTLASDQGTPIVPVRVQDVPLTGPLEYMMAIYQWVDAFSGTRDERAREVARRVAAIRPPAAVTGPRTVELVRDEPPRVDATVAPAALTPGEQADADEPAATESTALPEGDVAVEPEFAGGPPEPEAPADRVKASAAEESVVAPVQEDSTVIAVASPTGDDGELTEPDFEATDVASSGEAATEVPEEAMHDSDASDTRDLIGDRGDGRGLPPRSRLVTVAAVAAVLLAGGVGGAVALNQGSGDDGPESSIRRAAGTELVADMTATPSVLKRPPAMAALKVGVEVTALSEVDTYGHGKTRREAPSGGRLIAFTIARWDCEVAPCDPLTSAGLSVAVDNDDPRELEDGAGTYVVAVPHGAKTVNLVLAANDVSQTISLLDGSLGTGNVAVLARRKRVFVQHGFDVTRRTSISIYGESETQLRVKPGTVRLTYFSSRARPSGAGRAILVIGLRDERGGKDHGYPADYVSLRDDDDHRYRATRLGTSEPAVLGFDVPADLRSATLTIDASYPVSTEKELCNRDRTWCWPPYTVTLGPSSVTISLR